jgi:hypothetical protein
VLPEWEKEQVNLCSWFLSAGIVGGHKKEKPLTPRQETLRKKLNSIVDHLKTYRRGKEKK